MSKERNGYLVEFPGHKRKRVFYGADRAETKAFNYGQTIGHKLGVVEFTSTDLISARTTTFIVGQRAGKSELVELWDGLKGVRHA